MAALQGPCASPAGRIAAARSGQRMSRQGRWPPEARPISSPESCRPSWLAVQPTLGQIRTRPQAVNLQRLLWVDRVLAQMHGSPAAGPYQSAIERAAAGADLHSVLVWRLGRML